MTTEDTRSFLTDLFERLTAEGWSGGSFLDALADDLVWTVTGTSPISGVYRSKQEYATKVFGALDERLAVWPTPEVRMILADGEWATVLFDSTGGHGKNGTSYNMSYCWLMRVVNQRIREVIGFYDQVKVADLFA